MKSRIPRIMIAAPSSGSGKTTVVCGVLKLLKDRGLNITSFKCGPDYIDPMFHKKALDIDSRNLDLFLNNEDTVKYLLAKNSANSDVSVIEGVMGYYDGIAGKSLSASSYDLSRVTKTPTILVINAKGKSTSIIPEIKGFIEYRDDSNIEGVILNNISPMLYPDIKELIEVELQVKVLGYAPKDEGFNLESRHLGLVTPSEIAGIEEKISYIASILEKTIDVDSIIEMASRATDIEYTSLSVPKLKGARIALARDKAFCFYYSDNLDLLLEMGAELVEFSPLKDSHLPKGINGLIIGGGYPEVFASHLSQNKSLLNDIREKLKMGLPTLAECGGFMYLGSSIVDKAGQEYSMVDYIPMKSSSTGKLSRFGYVTLTANEDNMLCSKGDTINAHEFHYWDSTENGESFNATKPLRKRSWSCINYRDNVIAGYPHMHYYSNINFPYNFLKKCIEYN
ncbi:cobyrinate a,c-diamide synthase [Clostridium cylindrosporum]|uniref:Cobyrinate a,c-diamide synthase n=1 Tax=Clostridium cylindrosporum DSM 605 TaxID=1121307 RepID=A0A0J8D6Z9_CLOCY|nr:cobyrinate a,c-diamide synthase [Clostridium cylindrosporum]KMT21845.1 cobyrinic acid A,C-diamide synthase cobB [Clostridium cylindrosporum DSM 605]